MRKVKKINKDNKGFTLVELIVTVVILALVTAPFLSSFVTASNTNVKSKRVQEANELGQYVIEHCKALSFDKIETEYGSKTDYSKNNSYAIDASNVNYNQATSKSYSWKMTGSELPSGYPAGYEAEVKITPTKSVINGNEAVPVIEDINRDSCIVLNNALYRYDKINGSLGANKKELIIDIDMDTASTELPYIVKYTINYYKPSEAIPTGSYTETFKLENKNTEADAPTLYLLYTPMSGGSDKIIINNNLLNSTPYYYNSSDKVNIHLIEQKSVAASVMTGQVEFKDIATSSTNITLNDLLTNDTKVLDKTVVYTNIDVTTNDKDNTVNAAVLTKKIDTIYEIDVEIKYDGRRISSYSSTKLDEK